jgi:mannose-6-phosphate isomerase-like protein (cupin superfamily)
LVELGARTELELGAGGVVPIPQQTPHELRNSGPGVLCAVGFFATASPVSTFDEPVMPGGTRVRGTTR